MTTIGLFAGVVESVNPDFIFVRDLETGVIYAVPFEDVVYEPTAYARELMKPRWTL